MFTSPQDQAPFGSSAPARVVAGCALLIALSRLLFGSRYLYHWDSVNFATALLHYDVRIGQPHVPGYILYVALIWPLNALLGGDANQTMVLVSALSSGALAAVLWRLAERLFPLAENGPARHGAGPIVTLLLAGNPLLWFYGGIALPHVPDAALTGFLALLWWRLKSGETRLLFPSALLLGIAAGVRQQNVLFLMPLFLFSARREPLARIAAALALTLFVCCLWFTPMVLLSGGVAAYVHTARAFSESFFRSTSLLHGAGLPGVLLNADRLARYTTYALLFVGVVLAAVSPRWLFRARATFTADERGVFLLLWMTPSLLFYLLIHMGPHGLIFTFLVPVLLVCAGLLALAGAAGRNAAVFAAASGALLFALAPEHLGLLGKGKVLNAATVRNLDNKMEQQFATIRARWSPEHSLVVARNCRHVGYYLPAYRIVWSDRWEPAALQEEPPPANTYDLWWRRRQQTLPLPDLSLPRGVRFLIITEPDLAVRVPGSLVVANAGAGVRSVLLPPGARVSWSPAARALVVKRR